MREHILNLMKHDVSGFLIVGGCSTFLDFCIYMLLAESIPLLSAKTISIGAASLVSYFLNKNWTFKSKVTKNTTYFARFYIGFSVAISINMAMNYYVFEATGMKVLAFVMATACCTIVNYLSQRFFVFRKRSD